MPAELNSKIGARSGSMDANARSPEPMDGDESDVQATDAHLDVGSMYGSSGAEYAVSVAGFNFPSSGDAVCSGSRAKAVIGAISYVRPDDIFRSC